MMARGDHLFIDCGGYSHHGIECDDRKVVHFDFRPVDKFRSCLGRQRRAEVRMTSWEKFADGKKVMVREYHDTDPADLVVRRAMSRLGDSEYHLFENNCEHFAHWCKTGEIDSSQVDAAREASRPLVVGAVASVLLRLVPLVSPQARIATGGLVLAYSLTRASTTYVKRRWQDRKAMRS